MSSGSSNEPGRRGGEKYREAMAHLEVSPDVAERVVAEAVRATGTADARRRRGVPAWMPLAACLALVALIGGAAFLGGNGWPGGDDVPDDQANVLVTGSVEVGSLAELSETVGFEVSEPDEAALPFDPVSTTYTAYGDVAEVFWSGADGQTACYRVCQGSDDPSGDYNDYADITTADGATLKGEGGTYALALWDRGGYSFSLALEPGLDADAWSELLGAWLQ